MILKSNFKNLIIFLVIVYFFLLFNNKLFETSLNIQISSNLWQIRIPDFVYLIIIFLIFLNKFKKINYLESKIYLSIVLIFLIIVHSLILSNINKNYEIQIDSLFRLVSYIIFAYLISIQFSKKEFLKFFQFFLYFFLNH